MVIGMPVMITQNFDVEGGIVNGTTGTLKKIRYYMDNQNRRHATSCVVESNSVSGDALPNLSNHEAAVLEDTSDMHFIHPHSKKKCTIKRTQLPLAPAFAMTTHKAQGKTMKRAIVDVQSCRGTEAPYVMLSRVKSLAGLLILRPFDQKKIQCRQSEDLRKELQRLQRLDEKNNSIETLEYTAIRDEIHVGMNEESSQTVTLSHLLPALHLPSSNLPFQTHTLLPRATLTRDDNIRVQKRPYPPLLVKDQPPSQRRRTQ
jgi:hypothetical protein